MKKLAHHGMALDKLLIAIMTVSVVSTAIWNYQMKNAEIWTNPLLDGGVEEKIKGALDDIKYHLVLAGYGEDAGAENYALHRGKKSDIITIRHNGITVEYSVDKGNNLIRRMESVDKVLAENIDSIRSLKIGRNVVVITISPAPYSRENENEIETLSKSYSVIVEMNNLL